MSDLRRFRFRAVDAQGRTRQGVETGTDANAVQRRLETSGLTLLQLTPELAEDGTAKASRRALSDEDRAAVLLELSTLLKAGVTLAEAAPSLEQAYAGQALAAPLRQLRQGLQKGQAVAVLMSEPIWGLPAYARTILGAGEAAGELHAALATAASQLEADVRLQREFRNALIYPAILVLSGIAAVLTIFIAVVPRFASVLRSARAEVPALSRWVIEAGVWLQSNWLSALLIAMAVMGLLVLAARNPELRASSLQVSSRLPVIGPWLQQRDIGRWAGLLGQLLAARVPLLRALELSEDALLLPPLRQYLRQAASAARRGIPLSETLTEQGWIAPARLNLVRVGERAGTLSDMLIRLGVLYQDSASQLQRRVLALIEPLAILIIGALIGFIMVAVMMAVTSLNTIT